MHLNGAIPAPIIREILADEATELPSGFLIERDLLRNTPCQSLASYLTPWQALRLFPKKRENLDRISSAVFAGFVENGVRFVELRSSVLYLAHLQNCSPTQALEYLIESTRHDSESMFLREPSSCSRKHRAQFSLKLPSKLELLWAFGCIKPTSEMRTFCFQAVCTVSISPPGNTHE